MADLFTLRPVREEDMPYLNAYCHAEGMDVLPGPERITVAVNDEDVPVGFIRLVRGANGIDHVNPVVTYALWRGYGVGRALIKDALASTGELRFVARGASIPFYEHLGFSECGWDEVDTSVTEECDGCPLVQECHPLPMKGSAAEIYEKERESVRCE